ncbi:MAG: hypothetical protein JSU01_17960 [Bacteroidetes bacterium]|nr:hypothetical protein [Bacteroidota bacterium]
MEEFAIQGGSNFIKIIIDDVWGFPDQTGHWGGYDAKAGIEIKSGAFYVKSYLYTSTGEFYQLYEQLVKANQILKGEIYFMNYEENLKFDLIYDANGHISITGNFYDINSGNSDNRLEFGFESDQSYIQSTISQLKTIVDKYGGMKGINK